MKKYLFIRILEACNADCFMCVFARSKDQYRFSKSDLFAILDKAKGVGVEYVRLTGGEPLLHLEISEFVRIIKQFELKSSIITNGASLPTKISELSASGLDQIVVSIDGTRDNHDKIRGFPGLFDRCIDGISKAKELGIRTRVNTVVGPHNYQDMLELQKLFTDVGINQWELTALKLDRPIVYPDRQAVIDSCDRLYHTEPGLLVPMGLRFYGESRSAQDLFFDAGVCPKPTGSLCNVVGNVIYIDPKIKKAFGCSLLPHRTGEDATDGAVVQNDDTWSLTNSEWNEHVRYYRTDGHRTCKGCSTTAAAYSNRIDDVGNVDPWEY